MLHVGDCFDHIAHALHYTDAAGMDERIKPSMIVNHAGHFLYSLRAWNFAQRMIGSADFVQGQEWIDPPLGCAEVIQVDRNYSASWPWPYRMNATDLASLAADRAYFQALQGNGIDATQFYPYRYAPVFERSDLGGDGLTLRLHIGFTPTTSETNAIQIAFRAEWEEIPDNLDDINDWTLPIPKFAEQLFLAILRETAKGYEMDSGGNVEERLAQVRAWPSFDAAKQADQRAVNHNGQPRNTAIDMGEAILGENRSRDWPIASVVYLPSNP